MGWRWITMAMVLCAGGCSPAAEESACASSAGIHNGSLDSAPLALSPQQKAAIVALESSNGALACTGSLVGSNWVLTAAHCAQGGLVARLGERAVTTGKQVLHPEFDVMLLELSPGSDVAGAVELAPWQHAIDASWLGRQATLAGYGATQNGVIGVLFFAHEPIVAVNPTEIWVDGGGNSGACGGDSGGPLLVTDSAGQARVAGVLDRGSASCVGLDVYTRSDVLSEWIRLTTDAVDPPAACK